jgi:CubicO group peptidase (beta-lactamase class C family)
MRRSALDRARTTAPRAIGAVAVALLAFITACDSDSDSSSGTDASTSTTTPTVTEASSASAASSSVPTETSVPTEPSVPVDRPPDEPSVDPARAAVIEQIAEAAMTTYDLNALIVRVTADGENVFTGAFGESVTGVPATPEMHYRNGAFAFTYIAHIMSQMVDEGIVSYDDTLSTWLPDLPSADAITLRNLLNMTSGYADYVYQPEVLDGTGLDPFRHWTSEEMIEIGTSVPLYFEPGTNWGYSHTNYVILGRALEQIAGKPMAEIMQEYIVEPMGLTNTSSNENTPLIPEPVLHSFSSERREAMQIAASNPFYEETTFWNPSWTTAEGAVQTTDIYDMTRSMEIVGDGELLSPETHQAMVGKNLVGFGSPDPTGRCPVCFTNEELRSYGLGVVLLGDWITQTKNFYGSGATGGYLSSEQLTVSVVTTYKAAAFDPTTGAYANTSEAIFSELAAALAPESPLPLRN